YLECGLFNAIIISAGFMIGVHWGAKGVALAYAICNYIVLYPWLRRAFLQSPVSFHDFVQACTFPALASLLGALCAWAVRPYLPETTLSLTLVYLLSAFSLPVIILTSTTKMGRQLVTMLVQLQTSHNPQLHPKTQVSHT